MTDTQKGAFKGSNGTATRVAAPISPVKGGDGSIGNNRHNGAKSSSPQSASSALAPVSANNGKSNGSGNGEGHVPTESQEGSPVKSSAKKRRKVNHACIYCRRSHMTCDLERPCTRCIKRNIGHLCHDEPREPAKKAKPDPPLGLEKEHSASIDSTGVDPLGILDPSRQDAGLGLGQISHSRAPSLVQPTPVPAPRTPSLTSNNQAMLGFQDWNFGSQSNLLQDMHGFHPQYSFGTSELSNEYNLLNDFLTNSMLEEGGMYSNEDSSNPFQADNAFPNTMHAMNNNLFLQNMQPIQASQMLPPSQANIGSAISRPASGFPMDKAREAFYMTAADPAGNESPAERMKKLMKAKYDAGLLKPYNYVSSYKKLGEYMAKNLHTQSRSRIARQLDNFRPKFREQVQGLTDMQLVFVESEIERSLMQYDRVFASMAIPACCWRRTGEICRGNNEMAKLLGVPLDMLRDGKLAIYEVFAENSLVSYWEKFGQIAFDSSQKAILTSCSLRTREQNSSEPEIRCCFSFTIRRDTHHVPSLIVGNFLPIKGPDH